MSQSTTTPETPAVSLSTAFVSATQRAGKSLVNIDARRWPTSGIAWSADGTFIAANHAIERDEEISILGPDGKETPAKLVGRDPSLDLAVLKADVPLAAGTWRDASAIQVGELVLGLFRPDEGVRARLGMVSGIDEGFHTPWGGKVDTSLSVDISTRNLSALALADAAGHFFGFHVSGDGRGRGLVLPRATLERVVTELTTHGRVERAYLGINTQPVRLPVSVQEAAKSGFGLLVVGVEPKSPAELSGLSLGDVLVSASGTPLRDVGELLALLSEAKVGAELSVKVLRTGALVDVAVKVGARP